MAWKAVWVTNEEPLRAGVHFVRVESMLYDYDFPLEAEFNTDGPESEYVLVLDGNFPVSTCRIKYLDPGTAQIERVATVRAYRGQGAGRRAIEAAEQGLRERGIRKVKIHSRECAIGFYERLGYVTDRSQSEGEGDFILYWTTKDI